MHDAHGRRIPIGLTLLFLTMVSLNVCGSAVLALALVDFGGSEISGQPLFEPTFLRRSGFVLGALIYGSLQMAVGIRRGRYWTRAASFFGLTGVFVFCLLQVAVQQSSTLTMATLTSTALVLVWFLQWYFYRCASTVAYYRNVVRAAATEDPVAVSS